MTIPTFCSCGFSPRPSAGVKASRSNGSAAKIITLTKKVMTAAVTPATYGIRWAKRRGVSSWAALAKSESTTAQKSSEPFCPAQKAEKM